MPCYLKVKGGMTMRFSAILLLAFFTLSVGLCNTAVHGQPSIPKENIPSGLAPAVKNGINKLYSPNPIERAQAAHDLGLQGTKAAPAVPFLVGILHEAQAIQLRIGALIDSTSPGYEAAKALTSIGEPAVGALTAALKDDRQPVRFYVVTSLGEIASVGAVEGLITALADKDDFVRKTAADHLATITGEHFGPDHAKWKAWWTTNKSGFKPRR
jgi:hypothetical protein